MSRYMLQVSVHFPIQILSLKQTYLLVNFFSNALLFFPHTKMMHKSFWFNRTNVGPNIRGVQNLVHFQIFINYKHRCESVYLSIIHSFTNSLTNFFTNLITSVHETSTGAWLAPVSCTVEYRQLYMCTLNCRVVQLGPNPSRKSCSRIVLVCLHCPP